MKRLDRFFMEQSDLKAPHWTYVATAYKPRQASPMDGAITGGLTQEDTRAWQPGTQPGADSLGWARITH